MSIKRRVEKLEMSSGVGTKHTLNAISAANGENLVDAVSRVAAERGLTLAQVGYAWVHWPDDRAEEYRVVDDPWNLVGWQTHEQAMVELGLLENTAAIAAGSRKMTPDDFNTNPEEAAREWRELKQKHGFKATTPNAHKP